MFLDIGNLTVATEVARKMRDDINFRNFVKISLGRYIHKDWGEMSEEDKKLNDEALTTGGRVVAAYSRAVQIPEKEAETYNLYIITEADRSVTTILFPEEY